MTRKKCLKKLGVLPIIVQKVGRCTQYYVSSELCDPLSNCCDRAGFVCHTPHYINVFTLCGVGILVYFAPAYRQMGVLQIN